MTALRITPLLFALFALCAAAPAQAIDLLDVWRAAATHDPAYAAARAAREAGQARHAQAGALWRPNVALEGGIGVADHDTATRGAQFSAPGFGSTTGVSFDTSVNHGTATRYGVALRQPLLDRERSAQAQQLDLAAEMAELQWQQAQQTLMLRSAQTTLETTLAAEHLRLLQRQQSAVDKALAEAQDRFRLGDRPVTDVHEATARAQGLTAERLGAQTALELQQAELSDLSGLPAEQLAGSELPRPGPTPPPEDLATLDAWLARAAQHNLAVRLAETQLRNAEAEAHKTSAAFSPTVDLVARVGRERLAGSGDFDGSASNTASDRAIGVQLTVPLYTGGMRSARQQEAIALVDQARADVERARQQARQEARGAWLDLAVGRSQLQALEAALTASRARLDATRTGLQAGDRTTLDVLNAENDAAGAELALQQARVRLLMHRLRLAAAAGELDESRLQQANASLVPATH